MRQASIDRNQDERIDFYKNKVDNVKETRAFSRQASFLKQVPSESWRYFIRRPARIRLTGSLPSMFWMIFMGLMLLTVAVFAAVGRFRGKTDPKLPALFLLYAVMFAINAYQSDVGYYSGLRERVNIVLSRFTISLYLNDMKGDAGEVLRIIKPADINIVKILALAFGAGEICQYYSDREESSFTVRTDGFVLRSNK